MRAPLNFQQHKELYQINVAVQTLAPAAVLGPVGWLAAAGFLTGFAFETIADLQKFNFKSANPDMCDPA